MTVKPVISSVNVYVNGVYKPPGTYSVKKGSQLRFDVTVVGEDGGLLERTNCLIWLLNKRTGKAIFEKQFTLTKDQKWYGSGAGYTINDDVDLIFQTWWWNGNRWVFADQSGEWVFNVGSHQQPHEHAKPRIVRNQTFLVINGVNARPGTYLVKKGAEIGIKIKIENEGKPGKILIMLKDEKGGWVYSDTRELYNELFESSTFFINESKTLTLVTYYWDNGWKKYDEYGSWKINVLSKPYPVIEKNNSYIILNGKMLPAPPVTVKAKENSSVKWICSIRNKGGTGKCRLLVYDVVNKQKIDDEVVTLTEGGGKIFAGTFILKNNVGIKFITYAWDGKEWQMTDEYG